MTWGWWAGSPAAATPATAPRVRELDQSGWNAGYREGEMERQALAAANSELRTEVRELRAQLKQLTKETP